MSDKELTAMSGLVDLLEEGDEVMADKGFEIQDILSKAGAKWVIPPFLHNKQQMATADAHKTKTIANLRIHVERSIRYISTYRILQGVLPASMWDYHYETVFVCAMLTNFLPPLVAWCHSQPYISTVFFKHSIKRFFTNHYRQNNDELQKNWCKWQLWKTNNWPEVNKKKTLA